MDVRVKQRGYEREAPGAVDQLLPGSGLERGGRGELGDGAGAHAHVVARVDA